MTVEKINHENHLLIIPGGRMDSVSAGDLETCLNESINEETKSLTVDLSKVDFVSSKGLRVLVSAYKKMNGREMILKNADPSVMEVLRLSGLLKVFNVQESEE